MVTRTDTQPHHRRTFFPQNLDVQEYFAKVKTSEELEDEAQVAFYDRINRSFVRAEQSISVSLATPTVTRFAAEEINDTEDDLQGCCVIL